MHKKEAGRQRSGNGGWIVLAALALMAPLFAGCSSPRQLAQAQPLDGSPTALISTPSPALPTADVPSGETPVVSATGTVSGTIGGTASEAVTGTVVLTGTVTGTAQAAATPPGGGVNPFNTLNTFRFLPVGKKLVRRDRMQLDAPGEKAGDDEVLLTITGPSDTITDEVDSGIGVLSYNTTSGSWGIIWSSEVVSGTASPLLTAGQKDIGGFNGGDLLRTGDPIFAIRTTLDDGRAQLHLWRWNRQSRTATPVKKSGGPVEGNETTFEADLDINLMDIDDDGLYEIVADNLAGVQIWKWDGNTFAVEGGR